MVSRAARKWLPQETTSPEGVREINVRVPSPHTGQILAYKELSRFHALRCGRRWGKSTFGSMLAEEHSIASELVGYFAPDYKRLTEIMVEVAEVLQPIRRYPSGGKDVIRTVSGGRIDFWTLEDDNAGRSRKYHRVIIDEAAFAKPNMMDIWDKAIKPTLLDFRGSATILSNTNGAVVDQFFWKICNEPEHGFKVFHAPSHQNPLLPREDLDAWAKTMHPLVYQQEILAEFVDWSGVAFFSLDKWLVDGKGIELKHPVENIFAIIDTALKTGKDNDGTAVVFFATQKIRQPPLVILDWDILQIEGALLERWLPSIFVKLEALAQQYKARYGSLGALIEDRGSGTVLLQQAAKKKWPSHPIPETLTALGKDERALNISGHHHTGRVKISQEAYDKVITYKETTRNHLVSQVTAFRIGDKDAARRADDLLDCYTYGVASALGNSEGF